VEAEIMNRIGMALSLLLIMSLTVLSIANGEDRVQKNGFVVLLPDGWVEIPRNVIDSYEKGVAKAAPNAKLQHYDYGFQLSGSKKWLDYPYVLIQVKNIGRIPESQLEKMEKISAPKKVEKLKDDYSSVMSNMQVGKMVYDKQNSIVWMRGEADVKDAGPISVIAGMVLTEKGFIQVNAYCATKDDPKYESLFRSIVLSVRPDHALLNKSTYSDSYSSTATDWDDVTSKALKGIIGGGIGFLIFRLIKKKANR
jgi:hypothetical protein